jgi:hypothetical protein
MAGMAGEGGRPIGVTILVEPVICKPGTSLATCSSIRENVAFEATTGPSLAHNEEIHVSHGEVT